MVEKNVRETMQASDRAVPALFAGAWTTSVSSCSEALFSDLFASDGRIYVDTAVRECVEPMIRPFRRGSRVDWPLILHED